VTENLENFCEILVTKQGISHILTPVANTIHILFPKSCCSVCRRIVGIAHVEDLESIKDASRRAECERVALNCAKTILKGRRQFETIEQVIVHIQSFDQD
jgi:5-methylthioribose kinase